MATNIFGREMPNQTYMGTQHLVGQAGPSNWTFNPGTGSYTLDGVQYGQTPEGISQPQDLGKVNKAPDKVLEGSSFMIDPEVMKKMWM